MRAFEIALEEAARATTETASRFVEPAEGTLQRALSKRNHIIFGRRGSGKTSLLQKARAEFVANRQPNAFVDLEKFKGHAYPDVLISVLIETFENLGTWLNEGAIAPANRQSFWKRIFTKPKRSPLNRREAAELAKTLEDLTGELRSLLHSQDEADITRVTQEGLTKARGLNAKVGVQSAGITSGVSASTSERDSTSTEVREALKRSKSSFLLRRVLDYQDVLRRVVSLSERDGFLLLDDLYHIPRKDQAPVLDYFHRLSKDTGLWLKVGTIRHRSTWYQPGDPSYGMKVGDDTDDIDLDVTLERYKTAKAFLLRVLAQLGVSYQVKPSDILNRGAQDRLVLASGGVARDFLTILRRAIAVGREQETARVGVEAINQAAGEHDSAKRDELARDASDGANELLEEFSKLRNFCLENNQVNCFTIEKDLPTEDLEHVKQLVDLRLLHAIASRITLRSRPGRIYEGYMIDVSQYTGERKRRGVEMLEFWRSEGRERLRSRTKLIYAERPD